MTNKSRKTLAVYHATCESHEQVMIDYNNLHRIDILRMLELACWTEDITECLSSSGLNWSLTYLLIGRQSITSGAKHQAHV